MGEKPSWALALEEYNAEAKAKAAARAKAGGASGEGATEAPPRREGKLDKLGQIPPFFKPRVTEDTFDKHVKLATIHEYVKSSNERILSGWNLEGVWGMLVQNSEEHPDTKDKFVTYAGVCNMAETLFEMLGPMLSFHFTPSKFLSFRRNPVGGISSVCYFTAICQRNLRLKIKLLLLSHDRDGSGMITMEGLESVFDEIVEKNMIQDVPLAQSGFRTAWKRIALHKFVVHLSRSRRVRPTDRFSIKSILRSRPFRQLTELPTLSMNIFYQGPLMKKIESNWFSLQSAQQVHRAFLNLDQDNDGFITKEEFRKLEPGMTDIFVERIFGEHVTSFDPNAVDGNQTPPKLSLKRRSSVLMMRKRMETSRKSKRGCMSYNDYLTFMVAWKDKSDPISLKYFFTVLDLESQGYLTHVQIHSFFREVFEKYLENNQYNDIRMEDVRDEIFDMVNQETPGMITMKDILDSSVQETLVDVLSDYNGFWRYDNREYLMQMEEEEEQ
ncbi:putative regulatory subunit B'' of serine/threonine-protein phosphatase 2A [Chloropicon primus]|nr:putative regulatory subunit B'' of serine/threonine-protein phosphatase 2A [Chloropicon primus]